MKLFNRGTAKPEDAAPAGAIPAAPAAAPAPAAPAAAPAAMPATSAAPPPAPEPETDPQLAAILDANVKEMSDKIAKLTTSLESTQTEKEHFEAKIEQMEERMRKLSALTEMISAQYNPFVGDAPTERDPLPSPEVGLSQPPEATAAAAADMAPLHLAPPTEDVLPPMPEMPSFGAPPAPEPAFAEPEPMPSPFGGPSEADMLLSQGPPADAFDAEPDEEPQAAELATGAHVWSIQPGFESSLLMLGWADMLLKNVPSRDSLADLVGYYHNIGWIGDPARDTLLAYADGIQTPENQGAKPDWRANVEIHEKSLLFLEKLKTLNRRSR